ncbi:hypothetical protein [Bacillus sp. OAE603]|uniref:hypothetical protein n=1 Tax=Gottfriedia sp. OAE603 TaxID=2663872 RepID=UPI00178A9544
MYSSEERELYFISLVNKLKQSVSIEGIIQLGSGVTGYRDKYSDIDLMVSTAVAVESAKEIIIQTLEELGSFFIKEVTLQEGIYLLIAFLKNGLELNVSVLATNDLNVKSPLWKIVFDRSGLVERKMIDEHRQFIEKPIKYKIDNDIVFKFLYFRKKCNIEVKRNNIIYALQMLEEMRKLTLIVQAFNEEKKLHQFKAYETLESNFINSFLDTYPKNTTKEAVIESADEIKDLFFFILKESPFKPNDENYHLLMNE